MRFVERSRCAKAHFFIGSDPNRVVGSKMAQTGREALIEQITAIVNRVAESEGLEAVEIEFLGGGKQRLLRIFIDRAEGVTHGDCELVSQKVGSILDAEDVVPGEHYTLEVSSPGVERKL